MYDTIFCLLQHKPHSNISYNISYISPGIILNFLLELATALTAISSKASCILTAIHFDLQIITPDIVCVNHLCMQCAVFWQPHNKQSIYQLPTSVKK